MSSDIKAAHYRDRSAELLARVDIERDPEERQRLMALAHDAAEKAARFEAMGSGLEEPS